ncbi:hypothetical protein GDO81_010759 [Engystomops pustulosus]|uniref:Uncharacterized protein n=1 Tax=Engystomops pustulosus TaxID=76066 RepID=A0AAV7C441_ENGPU|nr:hypothetical protein GDO81_010759 [Engystomops pustulosus]
MSQSFVWHSSRPCLRKSVPSLNKLDGGILDFFHKRNSKLWVEMELELNHAHALGAFLWSPSISIRNINISPLITLLLKSWHKFM